MRLSVSYVVLPFVMTFVGALVVFPRVAVTALVVGLLVGLGLMASAGTHRRES